MTDAPELNFEALRRFGFAPGSYMCFCSDCGEQHMADKRAWRCVRCAENRANLSAAERNTAYVAGWNAAIEAVIPKIRISECAAIRALAKPTKGDDDA